MSRLSGRSHVSVASVFAALTFAAIAASPGCGNDSNSPRSARLSGTLSGAQEVPPVETPARGSVRLDVNRDETRIDVTLETSGLADVMAAHIHAGPAGVNGPVIFGLYSSATDGPFASPLELSVTETDLAPAPELSILTFADALAAIERGDAYVNVHTMTYPSGEIRAQTGPARVEAVLSGAQESAIVATAGTGSAAATLSDEQDEIRVDLEASGLSSPVVAAHIHVAPPGTDGPVVFDLLQGRSFSGSTSVTLGESDFEPSAEAGVPTFEDAVAAIVEGRAYVNVHTESYPAGEVRGQLGRAAFALFLSGAQESPPVASAGSGTARIGIDAAHSRLDVSLETAGLVDVVAAHVHAGAPGVNGPILFGLYDASEGPFTGSLEKTLGPADLAPAPDFGVADFNDAIDAIFAGRAYVNVHTMANTAGEIRGQAGPVALGTSLSGAQETPPVATAAKGTGIVRVSGDQSAIRVMIATSGLAGVTVAHIHAGVPGAAGPPIFDLFDATIDGPFTGALDVTVGADDLDPSLGDGIATYADAVSALLAGRAYVNVHTMAYGGGEIRGHVGPLRLDAFLDGSQETPSVPTLATGTGAVFLGASQRELRVSLETTGLVDVTAAHIHAAPPGFPGGIVFGLYEADEGPFPARLEATLDAASFRPLPVDGIETFADAVAALVSGNTYFNVHTMAHMAGEIRGQIVSPLP